MTQVLINHSLDKYFAYVIYIVPYLRKNEFDEDKEDSHRGYLEMIKVLCSD